jgi:hypothetical protein
MRNRTRHRISINNQLEAVEDLIDDINNGIVAETDLGR